MDVHLVFSPVWSWPLMLLAAGLVYGLVLGTYPSRIRSFPTMKRRLLLGLRLVAATVLLFAMLRPALEFSEIDEHGAQLVFLIDHSRSMNTPDGPAGVARGQQLRKTIEDIGPSLKALREKVDIRFIEFAESSKTVEALSPTDDGPFTAIGQAIDELRKEDQSKRLAATFLLSDGAQRATGDIDVDPRAAARRFAAQKSVPIYTTIFGTPEISTTGSDIAVEDLLVNPLTYERKIEVVKARVRMVGAAGRTVRVKLMIEDRAGKKPGEPGEWKDAPVSLDTKTSVELTPTENAIAQPVQLSFVAMTPGEFKIALVAEPLPGEVKTTNNQLETLITVTKGGMSVAYFDRLGRTEQKFIRRINETRIRLDWIADPKRDASLFEKGKYDVYILGDLPASAFRTANKDLLDDFAARVREGAGLCLLGGELNYSTGGYAGTELGKLFPVKLDGAARPPGQIDPTQQLRKKIQMLPTETGENHFLMIIDPNNNDQAWRALPKLNGATRLVPANASTEILAESGDGDPLLLATDVGRSRVAALAVDETYLWFLSGHGAVHQRFWQQLLLWLAHKEQDSDQALRVVVDPRNFAPGGKVPILVSLHDKKNQPVPEAEFQVEVQGPNNTKPVAIAAQKNAAGATAEFVCPAVPGDYWVSARALVGGKSIGLPATTRFIVESRDPELDNPASDPDLMAEVAELTGASVVPPEKLGTFLDDLLKSGISTELTRNRLVNLWDNWPLMLIFVGLMSVEWFIRKRNGLV
jgi:hypothetical protein